MGFHLFPFRTEKLSPFTPMVLRQARGRVGSRLFKPDPLRRVRLLCVYESRCDRGVKRGADRFCRRSLTDALTTRCRCPQVLEQASPHPLPDGSEHCLGTATQRVPLLAPPFKDFSSCPDRPVSPLRRAKEKSGDCKSLRTSSVMAVAVTTLPGVVAVCRRVYRCQRLSMGK